MHEGLVGGEQVAILGVKNEDESKQDGEQTRRKPDSGRHAGHFGENASLIMCRLEASEQIEESLHDLPG